MAAAAEWWEAVKAAIAAYTGLSPAAFFTAVAVAAALYVAVSGLFARPALPPRRREAEVEERAFEPLPPLVQLGEMTGEELRAYDGSDSKKPLLMAIKGQIYDVTQSRMFYGPGGPYALFAGRDASRALAKMSFEPNDLTGDISGLGPFEVQTLQEWEYKFMSKYMKVGTIKTIRVAEGGAAGHAGTCERGIDASTTESTHVPEPEEDGNTSNRSGAVEKPREAADVDVNTSNHEDAEKPKGLIDVDAKSTSSHEDAVEKPEETPNADLKNTSSTEDAGEQNGTPGVDERSVINPEDAVEKQKEEPDVDVKNTSSPEDAVEKPKEEPDVDVKNTSTHQDAVEKPKEAADVEVKNA